MFEDLSFLQSNRRVARGYYQIGGAYIKTMREYRAHQQSPCLLYEAERLT